MLQVVVEQLLQVVVEHSLLAVLVLAFWHFVVAVCVLFVVEDAFGLLIEFLHYHFVDINCKLICMTFRLPDASFDFDIGRCVPS